MSTKTCVALACMAFLMMGCAGSSQYPITGQAVGIGYQVQFMSDPRVASY